LTQSGLDPEKSRPNLRGFSQNLIIVPVQARTQGDFGPVAKSCDSWMAMTSRATFLSAIVATALAGCAASDDRADQFLLAPDRYVLYNCPQLAKAAQSTVSRQRKLEMLMAKAEVDSFGVLVSRTTYRPEYAQLGAMMNQLHKAAADKNCKLVPGAENSDGVVENEPSAIDIYGLPGGLH
jgi:hypothetical protein